MEALISDISLDFFTKNPVTNANDGISRISIVRIPMMIHFVTS
jgi:hypothetical protein